MNMMRIQCDICHKKFNRNSSFQRHNLHLHSGYHKRYECGQCGKVYHRQDNLSRHERHHHQLRGLIECKQCSRAFRSDYIALHAKTCRSISERNGNTSSTILKVRAQPSCDLLQDESAEQAETFLSQSCSVFSVDVGTPSNSFINSSDSPGSYESRPTHRDSDREPEIPAPLIVKPQTTHHSQTCDDLRLHIKRKNLEQFRETLDVLLTYTGTMAEADNVFQQHLYPPTAQITMLMYACWLSSTQIAEFLITEGADINRQDTQGQTVLHRACYVGSEAVVDLLLSKGADAHIFNKSGRTALDAMPYKMRQKFLRKLSSAKGNSYEETGDTEDLLLSTRRPDEWFQRTANELIEWSSYTYIGQRPPLDLALKYGSGTPQNTLKFRGPSVREAATSTISWLNSSSEPSYLHKVARQYLEFQHDILAAATPSAHLDVLKLLLDPGRPGNEPTIHGITALHLASMIGNDAMIDRLLDNGAKVDTIWRGKTALCMAVGAGKRSSMHVLIRRGASINGFQNQGSVTPLQYGCSQSPSIELEETIGELLAYGVDVNRGDRPALELALEHSTARVVSMLLDAEAELGKISAVPLQRIRSQARAAMNFPDWREMPDWTKDVRAKAEVIDTHIKRLEQIGSSTLHWTGKPLQHVL